jgi:hypothetical protein
VGSLEVVGGHPLVDRLLGGLLGLERRDVVQELLAQRPVEPLDLAGRGGRARLRPPGRNAVLAADALEEDLHRRGPGVPAGELLSVVGQHLRGHPITAHGQGEGLADRPATGHGHDLGDHDESRVIVDAGDHLAFASVSEHDATDEVELPQVHRCFTLPATVLELVVLRLGPHEAVAHQHPVHGGP